MGRVIHFEIHCGDVDRAERFYTAVFGWEVQRWEGPVDYRLLKTGEGHPGIDGALMPRTGESDGEAVRAFVCTIGVDDIAHTEAGVASAGGQRVTDRMEIPGVGLLSYFKDTEGNVFGAIQPVVPEREPTT